MLRASWALVLNWFPVLMVARLKVVQIFMKISFLSLSLHSSQRSKDMRWPARLKPRGWRWAGPPGLRMWQMTTMMPHGKTEHLIPSKREAGKAGPEL